MTEFYITEKVWEVIHQHTGIPSCEIKKDTEISAENRRSIIQDVGIKLRIPIHKMMGITTAGELADAAVVQIKLAI